MFVGRMATIRASKSMHPSVYFDKTIIPAVFPRTRNAQSFRHIYHRTHRLPCGECKACCTGNQTWYVHNTVIKQWLITLLDPHGHGVGSHAAHGPEGASEEEKTMSDLEASPSRSGHFDDSALAQTIGVFILEFGVLLHR